MDNAANLTPLEDVFLVIRVNAFTKRVDDGYVRNGKTRVGAFMSPAAVGVFIAENPSTRIDVLHV